jgi:hypothetical protein
VEKRGLRLAWACLETRELIKVFALLFLYFGAGPILGLVLKGRINAQRVVFALMCFMTISGFMKAQEWGLTLMNDEDYRGHARGFHFYFNEVLAIGLILAKAFDERTGVRLFPPGLWLYLLYCVLSFISLVNAPNVVFGFMAAFKAFKISLIFIAAYNFMRTEKEVHIFLLAMCATIFWETFVVLKLKYYDGKYQVLGTFEHQNALSMYATLIGMVLLAAGAGDRTMRANLYLLAYACSGVIVLSSLSRAGLVLFGGGTVLILCLGVLDKITWRRTAVVGVVAVIGALGLSKGMDTIIERFKDPYNTDSNQTRLMLNVASAEMQRDYRLGIGWNNYGIMINRPYRYGDIIDEWFLSHGETVDPDHRKGISESLYYLLLAETGWQGLGSFLAFMALFLYWNVRAAWFFRGRLVGVISLGIATGCGLNYAQSVLERVLTQPRNLMLWLILLALTARIETWRRHAVKRREILRDYRLAETPEPEAYVER